MKFNSAIATGILWVSLLSSPSLNSQTVSSTRQELVKNLSNQNLEISPQIQAQTATKVLLIFCDKFIEGKNKLTPDETEKFKIQLTKYFTSHPFYRIDNWKAKLLINETYADLMAKEFLPFFRPKLAWYLDFWISIIGEDRAWEYVKKDLASKDLDFFKKIFIQQILPAFRAFDNEIQQLYFQKTGENYIPLPISEYFRMINRTFRNPNFKKWTQNEEDQDLNMANRNIHNWQLVEWK